MNSFRHLLLLSLVLVLAASASGQDTAPTSAKSNFAIAADLMEQGKFAEALPIMEAVNREHQTANTLWNLGLTYAALDMHDKAVQTWLNFRTVEPENWRARAKLIQSYQALGNLKARDEERAKLLQLWEEGKDVELSETEVFCREQIHLGTRQVFVLEYFHPTGERMVIYSFIVQTLGSPDFKISLGSYESTNQVMWETGELPRDKRLYHLDLYRAKSHETHGFYNGQPSYEVVRAKVMSILAGNAKPMSATYSQ